jgi:nicotinamidase/pyrazinamidase
LATYDDKTCLLVVDVQNDFADPGGSLYVKGGDELVGPLNSEIERARAAGALVVYTQDWHPPTTPHFAKDGGTWPVHCVQGSWGARLHPDLVVAEGAIFVRTGSEGGDGYSAFSERDPVSGAEHDTGLAPQLRDAGIERVVVVGLATDYCVKETALDALRRGLAVEVPAWASRPVDLEPGDGERSLAEVRRAGALVS